MTDIDIKLGRLDAEITALTDTLQRDSRATRGEGGLVLPQGPAVLAERLALKGKIRELKKERAALADEKAAERPVRSLADIDAERDALMAAEGELRARLRELAVERDVALILEHKPRALTPAERRAAAVRARQ